MAIKMVKSAKDGKSNKSLTELDPQSLAQSPLQVVGFYNYSAKRGN